LGAEPPAGSFTHVDRALTELISLAELQVGQPLAEMSRAGKQQVVRFLDERGAFALRKSVETVADALGVSRFTVYNYLDSSRKSDESG
jgi:predicted transcriptional regulator YheO